MKPRQVSLIRDYLDPYDQCGVRDSIYKCALLLRLSEHMLLLPATVVPFAYQSSVAFISLSRSPFSSMSGGSPVIAKGVAWPGATPRRAKILTFRDRTKLIFEELHTEVNSGL
jgi:hypothetical protein